MSCLCTRDITLLWLKFSQFCSHICFSIFCISANSKCLAYPVSFPISQKGILILCMCISNKHSLHSYTWHEFIVCQISSDPTYFVLKFLINNWCSWDKIWKWVIMVHFLSILVRASINSNNWNYTHLDYQNILWFIHV